MPSSRAWLCCVALVAPLGCTEVLGLGDFHVGGQSSGGSSSGGENSGAGVTGGQNTGAGTSNGGGDPQGGSGGGGGDPAGGGGAGGCVGTDYKSAVLCAEPLLYFGFEDVPTLTPANAGTLGSIGQLQCAGDTAAGVAAVGDNALQLDNDHDCVVPVDDPALEFAGLATFSIEVWVQGPAFTTSAFPFIGNWDWSDHGYALFFFPRFDQDGIEPEIEFKRNAVPNIVLCSAGGACGPGFEFTPWHHVVATYDSAELATIYLDGQVASSTTLSNQLVASAVNLRIKGPASDYFRFDELAVYGRALTPAEVIHHFQCGNGDGC